MKQKIINIILLFWGLSLILPFNAKTQIRMTAKQMFVSADSLAQSIATNVNICEVSASNLDTMGKSNSWTYSFVSVDTTVDLGNWQMLYIVAESTHVRLDHYGKFGLGSIMDNGWMNSDSALMFAQRLGGSAVMKSYPSSVITAFLFGADYPPFDNEWQIDYDFNGTPRWVRFRYNVQNVLLFLFRNEIKVPLKISISMSRCEPTMSTIMFFETTKISFECVS